MSTDLTHTTKTLQLGQLDPFPDQNPNVMSDDDLATLAEVVKQHGPLQPILVARRPQESGPHRFLIVDGVHRAKATALAGFETIEAVVLPEDMPIETLRLLRIGMNKLRGELNLSRVADEFAELLKGGEVEVDDLLLTGFKAHDIDALLKAAGGPDDGSELMGQGLGDLDDDAPAAPKVFVLEIVFDTGKDMSRAKRALKRAAGKDEPLWKGLINMIEGGK